MSVAAKAAVQQALDEAAGLGRRMTNVKPELAQLTIGVTIAQELMKLRGEMSAIRILLSEQSSDHSAEAGGDMGNA